MAKPTNKRSNRSETSKTGGAGRNKPGPRGIREPGRKLDDVSDAPESGEPRVQGRSRGRVLGQ